MNIIKPPHYDPEYCSQEAKSYFEQRAVPAKTKNRDLIINSIATLVILGTVAAIVIHAGRSSILRQLTSVKGALGFTFTVACTAGGGWLIHKTVKNKNHGLFWGQKHWTPLYIAEKKTQWHGKNKEALKANNVREWTKELQREKRVPEILDERGINDVTGLSTCDYQEINPSAVGLSEENYAHLINDLLTDEPSRQDLRDQLKEPDFWENQCYLDTSTTQSGAYSIIRYKDDVVSKLVATQIFFATPLHVIGSIVANILRLLIIPTKMAYKKHSFEQIKSAAKQELYRIAKAPIYGAAVMIASLYMWIDKLNGMKLIKVLENEWNEGSPLHESGWAAPLYLGCCCQPSFLWKNITDSYQKALKGGGFYVAGCCQDIAKAEIDITNTITKVSGYTHFFTNDDKEETEYYPYFRGSAPQDSLINV